MVLQIAIDSLKCILLNILFLIQAKIHLSLFLMGQIDNKSSFVQAMAWHRMGDNPLPESMITQSTNAYMQF